MTRLTICFDGSCGPQNPNGTAAWGFIVRDHDDAFVHSAYGRVGSGAGMTSNVGEAEGLYQAMLWVQEHHPDAPAVFKGDSTLIINLINGVSRARKGAYLPYFEKAAILAKPYLASGQWSFEWIARAFNSEADKLSQYQRYRERKPHV
jgi:ribonuclease HI